MFRVLISFHQIPIASNIELLLCYYEALANELKNSGNEVLLLNVAFFKKDNWLGPVTEQIEYLKRSVREFNPELVITFNHQIFDGIYEIAKCPILVWDADSYEFFANKDLLHKNRERVHLVTSFKSLVDNYIEQTGIKKNNILVIQNATGIQKKNIPYNKGISFIGSFFGYNKLHHLDGDRQLYKAYINFLNSDHYDYQKFISKKIEGNMDHNTLFDIRTITLIYLLDLDLHLYGTYKWEEFEMYVPQLVYAYCAKPVFSLQENSEIYNSSKVCISISHPQTVGIAFPWRCFDIMASNGCLISSYSKDLKDLTKGWVDIPMFRTPIEARELCIKLLKDDIWRKELILASQNYIENNARWHHRFKQMQEILGIQLINKEKIGSMRILKPEAPLLERLIGHTINISIDKVGNRNNRASKNKKERNFHFRTKIWPRRRLDIKIKKINE